MKRDTEEVARVADLLRAKVREAGWSLRSVARSLEWHEDYLSQLLRGNPPLKVEQLLMVLRVLGVPPGEFFGELAEIFRRTDGAYPQRAASESGFDTGLLQDLIDSRIREILEDRESQRVAGGLDDR